MAFFKFKKKPTTKPSKPKRNKLDRLQDKAKKKLDQLKQKEEIAKTKKEIRDTNENIAKVKKDNSYLGRKRAESNARMNKVRDVATRAVHGEKIDPKDLQNLDKLSKYERAKLKRGTKDKNVKDLIENIGKGNPAGASGKIQDFQFKRDSAIKNAKQTQKLKHDMKKQKLQTASIISKQVAKNAGLVGAASALAAPGLKQAENEEKEIESLGQRAN